MKFKKENDTQAVEKPRLQDDLVADSGKRVQSLAVDAAIVFAIHIILMFIALAIIPTMGGYQESLKLSQDYKNEALKINEEAGLISLVEKDEQLTPIETKEYFKNYLLSNIKLAQEKDPQPFIDAKITLPETLVATTYETDTLAKFYYVYIPKYNNFNGKNDDLIKLPEGDINYKKLFVDVFNENVEHKDFWVIDNTTYELPYMKANFAIDLFKYINGDESYDAGRTNYNIAFKNFESVWSNSNSMLSKSVRYSTQYEGFKEHTVYCSYYVITGAILAFVISFFIGYVLPQYIIKNGKTIGKKAAKIRVVEKTGEPLKIWQRILRNVFAFFAYSPVMILTCFFTAGTANGWMTPLFYIGSGGVSLFNILVIIGIICLFSLLFMMFTRSKRSFHDLIAQTSVAYEKHHDELESAILEEKEILEANPIDESSDVELNKEEKENKE